MKNWTKQFLDKKTTGTISIVKRNENAIKAQKKIGIPKELWLDLSEYNSTLLSSIAKLKTGEEIETLFMAGVAVGWAEKNNKIK